MLSHAIQTFTSKHETGSTIVKYNKYSIADTKADQETTFGYGSAIEGMTTRIYIIGSPIE